MANSITIKNENNGVQRTIYTHQSVGQIAQAAHQASLAASRMEQAYIVRHPDYGLFLQVQSGAGSLYYKISPNAEPRIISEVLGELETKALTDVFRYTGKPIKK